MTTPAAERLRALVAHAPTLLDRARSLRLPTALRGARGLRLVFAAGLVLLAVTWIFGAKSLGPVGGSHTVPMTQVLTSAQQRQVVSATLYDDDHRVRIETRDGGHAIAAYPRSDADTQALLDTLRGSDAEVSTDPQTAKSILRLLLSTLVPVLVLGCLFGLVLTAPRGEGGAGEYVEFSK